jgi:hypothetical protein
MGSILKRLIGPLVDIVLIPWLLSSVLRTQRDRERAETIRIVAEAAAAQLVRERPEAEWAHLIGVLVRRISEGLPPAARVDGPVAGTVYRRAAEAALAAVKPAK